MRIALLACPRVQLLDVVGPSDVFSEANRQLGRPGAYRVKVIATEPGLLKGSSGLRLAVDTTVQQARGRYDTVLVAGSPYVDAMAEDPAVTRWLQAQARSARRIGSVCSGAFVLAAAGLLDGRRATTHWGSAQRLAAEHPQVQVEPDSIHIRDGNIYTSAGVAAGIDLALALVEEDHGRELALKVAREMVVFLKRPGGQSQFSAHLAAQTAAQTAAPDGRNCIREIQEHVLGHLRGDLSVPALAARAGMSERNFARVFRAEAGMTPAAFVEAARIDAARRLVEESALPLKSLADRVGYANLDGFRRAFVRRLATTPAEYRKRFCPG